MNKGVEIDGRKLKAALQRRNLSYTDASLGIGHAASYISSAINDGEMGRPSMILLERLYNIRPEEYIVNRVETPEKTDTPDGNKTYEIVYSAMYNAMKMAIKECMYESFKKAFVDGMREA